MSQTRQLAAIMFTDIIGYTSLMGNDEKKAFELLSKNRQIQKPIIEQYNGRWIKELGDGVMASFNTASDAVNAAMKIQEACKAAKYFQLKIGIHLGEVVFENDDVFGDGVNIASRIETLGVSSSVLMSKAVRDQIKNNAEFQIDSVGLFDLKNVGESIEVFAISNEGFVVPKREAMQGKLNKIKTGNRKPILFSIAAIVLMVASFLAWNSFYAKDVSAAPRSLAILPFENLQKDSTLYFLADGIPENLINRLSALQSNLKVFARSATFGLPDTARTTGHLRKLLHTDLVMRGWLQKSADDIYLNCELVDAVSQNQLWGNKYLLNINAVSGIEATIVSDLVKALNMQTKNKGIDKKEVDPAAYAEYLKGRHLSYGSTPAESEKALEHFREAIRIDPQYALAYAALANEKVVQGLFATATKNEIVNEARTALDAAMALDPTIPEIFSTLGALKFYYEWDWQGALEAYKKALELNPANATTYIRYSTTLAVLGKFSESLPLANKAIELDPVSISSLHNLGWCNLLASNFKESKEAFGKALELHPNWTWGYIKKAYGHVFIGEYAEAIALADKAQTLFKDGWGSELLQTVLVFIYTRCNEKEKADAVTKRFLTYAAQNTVKDPFTLSFIYYLNGNYEKAIEWEWKAVEQKSSNAYNFYIPLTYDKAFYNSPEHQKILKKMGFVK